MNLYCTSDQIGSESGGGQVTFNESEALKSLGKYSVWGRKELGRDNGSVWADDTVGKYAVDGCSYELAHFYSGTWSETVKTLKEKGCKVTYMAAAHDVQESKKEHELLGLSYEIYPHLTDPSLFQRYLSGYREADVLICPSTHSAAVMRGFGCSNKIEVIPHGTDLPRGELQSLPEKFTLGYLGAIGPDKGLIYLLKAWKELNYKDGSRLVFAGGHTVANYFNTFASAILQEKPSFFNKFDKNTFVWHESCVVATGWVDNVSDFYNNISCYVQPSVTEGFGIEVLEAMAHGRPVVCSTGAGAVDVIPSAWSFPARDVTKLAEKIDMAKGLSKLMNGRPMKAWREIAEQFTWQKIRERYCQLWKELL